MLFCKTVARLCDVLVAGPELASQLLTTHLLSVKASNIIAKIARKCTGETEWTQNRISPMQARLAATEHSGLHMAGQTCKLKAVAALTGSVLSEALCLVCTLLPTHTSCVSQE